MQSENKVAEDVYWVGVYFPDMKASLNAFLIKDEKVALIDTGAVPTQEMVLKNISEIVEPSLIDYIVLTHAEIDHCGAIPRILKEAPNAKVVTSQLGVIMLGLYGIQVPSQQIKDGETLSLGKKMLTFISLPIVDTWDNMYIFEEPDRVFFSSDLFGASAEKWTLFAENDISQNLKVFHRLKFPWIELVTPEKMEPVLERIRKLNPRIIAPGHGLILRSNIDKYLKTVF